MKVFFVSLSFIFSSAFTMFIIFYVKSSADNFLSFLKLIYLSSRFITKKGFYIKLKKSNFWCSKRQDERASLSFCELVRFWKKMFKRLPTFKADADADVDADSHLPKVAKINFGHFSNRRRTSAKKVKLSFSCWVEIFQNFDFNVQGTYLKFAPT